MKKVYAVLALALAVGGSAFALEENSKPSQEISRQAPMTGEGRVAALRSEYEQGKFNSLLDGLEEEYGRLQASGRVGEFAEMRRVSEADEQIKGLASQFDKMAARLLEERNAELAALCQDQSEALSAQRVKSLIAPVDEKQLQAIRTLSMLRFKTPDQAASPDERALIEIDLAYEFKIVHFNLHYAEDGDFLEKHIVLGMDKMKKASEASKSFSDADLKETVALAAGGFDAWQAKNLDLRDLLATAKKPSGDLDRSIAAVLNGYKAKKDDLYQREFLAKLN